MTETKGITSDYYMPTQTKKTGDSNLGKDDFLKILITQLQNQDPTSPMDDKEFISQMAQFSSLEQMQNIATSMNNLTAMTQQSQLIQFNSFIGKNVTWHEASDTVGEDGKPIVNSGTEKVMSVKYDGSEAKFVLESGKIISASNISEVLDTTSSNSTNSLVEASMLIGKKISYKDAEGNDISDIVNSVTKKDGKVQYLLSNGASVTGDQFTSISG
ncbi:flagellar hook assembly protein FlgD [Kurthia sibirica]|uniref:Basal-body rod modification protein FlgD n=1 Tax=Kurthia sibirica TaxID=202750 RepID=A0A2U3AQR2_9BACL|nr:flagellar hook assembly protein FlgD [Kurthia sibirica]PWI26900.1 flagellar hook assembly protein FlgD [Kurthia sibirica]GEK32559.1 hypothetical protein KSI01_00920 [Kurthia sibirica]